MTNDDLERFRSEWQNELGTKSTSSTSKDKAVLKASEQDADTISTPSDHAVRIYEQAVESEQVGQLGDSIILYRRAFKLDDEVDKRYGRYMSHKVAREQAEANDMDDGIVTREKNDIELNKDGNYVYNFAKTIQVSGVSSSENSI